MAISRKVRTPGKRYIERGTVPVAPDPNDFMVWVRSPEGEQRRVHPVDAKELAEHCGYTVIIEETTDE